MRISDWSSDVCSSDLTAARGFGQDLQAQASRALLGSGRAPDLTGGRGEAHEGDGEGMMSNRAMDADFAVIPIRAAVPRPAREVWDLIGGFFDLDKWLDVECAPVAGTGETGSNRDITGAGGGPPAGAPAPAN